MSLFVTKELKDLSEQILDRAVLKQQPITGGQRLREAIRRRREALRLPTQRPII